MCITTYKEFIVIHVICVIWLNCQKNGLKVLHNFKASFRIINQTEEQKAELIPGLGFLYGWNMIISHEHPLYRMQWSNAGTNKYNGAYYYSCEIVNNIIPNVRTSRNWITINIPGVGFDHAIVFIHNNMHPENYEWLMKYKDIVLVCGVPQTVDRVSYIGKAIYLPLSIDVDYVKQFETEKTRDAAYVGRRSKRRRTFLPDGIDYLEGMRRDKLLKAMAEYREVYAVGRCALEAKALGCEIKPYDPRYPDPELWQVVDNREAAEILQRELDQIDG